MSRWCCLLGLLLVGCIPASQIDRGKDRDGDGYVAVQLGGDDCRDDLQSVHPGAQEVCGNGIDDNCDGVVDDDGVGALTWYRDEDGDGYGDPNESTTACTAPDGYVADSSDCDDQRAAVHPGAQEVCGNGLDDDCNGKTDDNGLGASVWYLDQDGDGYGDSASTVTACSAPPNHVATPGDCNDGDNTVHPGAEEICNNHVDDNCDGSAAPCELRGDVSLIFANQRFLGTAAGARLGDHIAIGETPDGSVHAALSSGNDDPFYSSYVQGSVWLTDLVNEDQRVSVDAVATAVAFPAGTAPPYDTTGAGVALCNVAGGQGLDLVFSRSLYDKGSTPFSRILLSSSIEVLEDVYAGGSRDPADAQATITSSAYALGYDAPESLWCGPLGTGNYADVVLQVGSKEVGVAQGGWSGTKDVSQVDLSITDPSVLLLVAVGDLDHDGVKDIVVRNSDRSALVFSGSDTGAHTANDPDWTVPLPADVQFVVGGTVLDVDGDGFDDLLLADATTDDVGAVDIWFGPVTSSTTSSCRILGAQGKLMLGADVGDFNGDGEVDLVVQEARDSTAGEDAGAFRVFYDLGRCGGSVPISTADLALYGEVAGGGFQAPDIGLAQRAAFGDIDGDGFDDLLLSVPFATLQYDQAGAVYVLAGSGM